MASRFIANLVYRQVQFLSFSSFRVVAVVAVVVAPFLFIYILKCHHVSYQIKCFGFVVVVSCLVFFFFSFFSWAFLFLFVFTSGSSNFDAV